MLKKIVLRLLACALVVSLFTACGASSSFAPVSSAAGSASSSAATSDWEYVSGKGSLVIGITLFDPMNYYDETETLVGFDTELAQAVCKKLGVEPEFVEIDWNNKLMELDAKKIDCIWNGFTIMDDLENAVDYTIPYSTNYQTVVINQKNKDRYTDLASLAQASIGVEAGSAGEAAVAAESILSKANVVSVTAQRENLLELKSGTLDAAVIDVVMAQASVGEGTDFADLMVLSDIELSKEEYGVGFREGSDLSAKVNQALQELANEGFLEQLQEKYPSVMVCLKAE